MSARPQGYPARPPGARPVRPPPGRAPNARFQAMRTTPLRSPPPLQHPIPTHPRVPVPEPMSPDTAESPYAPQAPAAQAADMGSGYQRICSPSFPNTSDPYAYSNQRYAPNAAGSQAYAAQGQWNAGAPGAGDPYVPQAYSSLGATAEAVHNSGSEPAWGFDAPFGGGMMNDATTQMGMQFGRHVAQVGGEYVQKNLSAVLPMPVLKHYFNVSNSYVLHKLRILLFPWQHKPWSRRLRVTTPYGSRAGTPVDRSAAASPYERPRSAADMKSGFVEAVSYCPPREDVNSPDMYIPRTLREANQ